MVAVAVERLERSYGAFRALKGVSLDVRDQEFCVLLGPSGCGKTTLLRAIAGLDSVDTGSIRIGGRDVTALPARQREIAMVFQNYAVFPHMTVFENIAFGLRMRKVEEARIRARVGEAAEMMRISPYLDRFTGQLSGGQRQRVAVARALAVDPKVLLMDEPLSNLDALLRLEMRAELKSILARSRTTTIYVTHDQVEAMSLADRVAVMKEGEIVQYAPPMEVYASPANRFVGGFIGNPPMNFLDVRVAAGRATIGGHHLVAPAGAPAAALVGVRAEDLEIRDGGVGIAARVRVVEPLGPNKLVTVDIDGQGARVDAPNHVAVAPGEALRLVPREGKIAWFDSTSGSRL